MARKKKEQEIEIADLRAEVKTETQPETPVEEWVWMTGFKGTESDMKCRDYQFDMQQTFSIPANEDVVMCCNGFHLCKTLNDVFGFYSIGRGHRYFEVLALVRKEDLENYTPGWNAKLVARSIKFVRELDVDEILSAHAKKYEQSELAELSFDRWTNEHKRLALQKGVEEAEKLLAIEYLESLGYAKPFAKFVMDAGAYNVAKCVGSQANLGMDMKAMYIYGELQKNEANRRRREEREYAFYHSRPTKF